MNIHWPQLFVIASTTLSLAFSFLKHGRNWYGENEESPGEMEKFISGAIILFIIYWIYYKGGFFLVTSWSQIVLVIWDMMLLAYYSWKEKITTNMYRTMFDTILTVSCLINGGFFGV